MAVSERSMSNNWRLDFAELQKLLKHLNAYVEAKDFRNAKHMANLIKFHLTFDLAYEEERINQLKDLSKKGEDKR